MPVRSALGFPTPFPTQQPTSQALRDSSERNGFNLSSNTFRKRFLLIEMRAEKAITVKPEAGFRHGWCIQSQILNWPQAGAIPQPGRQGHTKRHEPGADTSKPRHKTRDGTNPEDQIGR